MHSIEDAVQPIQTNDAIGSQLLPKQTTFRTNNFFRDEQVNERTTKRN